MLRKTLLFLSHRPTLRAVATQQPIARNLARRFVAGETLDDAVAVIKTLNEAGMLVTVDYLGEHVTKPEEAENAVRGYLTALEEIDRLGLQANVSLKLTQMGLDLDEQLARTNLSTIVEAAVQSGSFVRVDMESSAYTQRTLDVVSDLHKRFENVGAVIQAYLRRSADDVRRMNVEGIRVRLCKGAYEEPLAVAYQHKPAVDRNFLRLAEALLLNGTYPAFATHDEQVLGWIAGFTDELDLTPDRYELQLLYGVRRDLQATLVRLGHRVRIYVPFGAQWYPFLMRRLAERPANLSFLLASLLLEARNGRRPE